MTYQEKLLDPRWQRKRLEIFQRDDWRCQKCGSLQDTLHAHHLYYEKGAEPWEYPMDAYMTLCASCHQEETVGMPVEEQELLATLRAAGYFHDHLFGLSRGFRYFSDVHGGDKEMGIAILVLVMQDKALFDELCTRYVDTGDSCPFEQEPPA